MTQLSKFWLLKIKSIVLCHVWLFATPWTVARQAPSEFSREEYWSGLPFLSPGDLPNPGIEPSSPASQANSLPSELPGCFGISSFLVSLGHVSQFSQNMRGPLCPKPRHRDCLGFQFWAIWDRQVTHQSLPSRGRLGSSGPPRTDCNNQRLIFLCSWSLSVGSFRQLIPCH